MRDRLYPTDTTDEQWELIGPVIAARKAQHPSVSGHDGQYEMRDIVDAIFYQNRAGCSWSMLPAGFPPASAVKYYFYTWRDEGFDKVLHGLLRAQVRERAGRAEDPSAVVLDSASLHAASNVPAATMGKDANKKVPGRKRGLAIDVTGLITAVVIVAACVHENTIGKALLDQVAADTPTVTKARVDQGFKQSVVEHGQDLGIDVEIVMRNPEQTGFVPQPKRYVVEQTNGVLVYDRYLVREYTLDPRSSLSRVYRAPARRIVRRLTGAITPSWRTPPTLTA
jgi:transposase